ncbi:hypothetical protein JCM11491_000071 [Sporobolomyces phaffii]
MLSSISSWFHCRGATTNRGVDPDRPEPVAVLDSRTSATVTRTSPTVVVAETAPEENQARDDDDDDEKVTAAGVRRVCPLRFRGSNKCEEKRASGERPLEAVETRYDGGDPFVDPTAARGGWKTSMTARCKGIVRGPQARAK